MVVILHEGKDDKKYVKRLFKHLNINNYTDDNFIEMNNKSNFYKENHVNYKTLKQKIENEEIEKVLFLLDADYFEKDNTHGKKENTISTLIYTINNLGFLNSYEIFVVCEPDKNEGYFETLFLSSVSQELKDCYQKFMDCTGFKGKAQTKTIMTKLHELSSPDSPYTFEHENFKNIKDFLLKNFK